MSNLVAFDKQSSKLVALHSEAVQGVNAHKAKLDKAHDEWSKAREAREDVTSQRKACAGRIMHHNNTLTALRAVMLSNPSRGYSIKPQMDAEEFRLETAQNSHVRLLAQEKSAREYAERLGKVYDALALKHKGLMQIALDAMRVYAAYVAEHETACFEQEMNAIRSRLGNANKAKQRKPAPSPAWSQGKHERRYTNPLDIQTAAPKNVRPDFRATSSMAVTKTAKAQEPRGRLTAPRARVSVYTYNPDGTSSTTYRAK